MRCDGVNDQRGQCVIETGRVVAVLTDLEGINEDLINLYEDIKENIDPRDRVARTEGARQLAEYADKLEAFEKVSSELRALIESISHVDMRTHIISQPSDQSNPLAGQTPHSPSEWFTHTHVAGFTLFGQTFVVSKWNRLYATLLQQLAERYPERFQQLPDTPPFNGGQRTSGFSRLPQGYNSPLALPYGVYCESTMAVRDMFMGIRRLLAHFGVPEGEMVVYLRKEGE